MFTEWSHCPPEHKFGAQAAVVVVLSNDHWSPCYREGLGAWEGVLLGFCLARIESPFKIADVDAKNLQKEAQTSSESEVDRLLSEGEQA